MEVKQAITTQADKIYQRGSTWHHLYTRPQEKRKIRLVTLQVLINNNLFP